MRALLPERGREQHARLAQDDLDVVVRLEQRDVAQSGQPG